VQAIKSVAARLGNTPSVCRKGYVHPAVLDSYMSGAMFKTVKRRVQQKDSTASHELQQQEFAMLDLLRSCIYVTVA
jgi:DNA topoisomerase-1